MKSEVPPLGAARATGRSVTSGTPFLTPEALVTLRNVAVGNMKLLRQKSFCWRAQGHQPLRRGRKMHTPERVSRTTACGKDSLNYRAGFATMQKATKRPSTESSVNWTGWISSRQRVRAVRRAAVWNDATQDAAAPGTALSDSGSFGGDRYDSSFGVQVEHRC